MVRPIMRSLALRVLLVAVAALLIFATTPTAHADTSGDTGMGYSWTDSQSPNPSTTLHWVDIAQTGTRVDALSACDDCVQGGIPIGFEFPFYGEAYSTVGVNSNGTLQFADTDDFYGPATLPTEHFPGPVIFPLWGDWDPRSSGNIYVETLPNWPGSGNQRALVVQWDNVENWDCPGGNNATWQVVLLEDGRFIFQYLDTAVGDLDCNSGADMTIGIQQRIGGCFVMYSYRFASVPDGTAIAWSPQPSACVQAEATETVAPVSTIDGPTAPSPTAGPSAQGPLDTGTPADGDQEQLGLPNDGSGPLYGRSGAHLPSAISIYLAVAGSVLLLAGAGWTAFPSFRSSG